MKRFLLFVICLLSAVRGVGQTTLSNKDWARIPADLRVKIKRIFEEDQQRLNSVIQQSGKTFSFMVEDGQYHYAVPAESIFSQYPRERKAPAEGNYVYNRWCDMTDVNAVYIGPDMFRITGQLPRMDILERKLDLTPIIQSFKGLYMLDFAQFRSKDPNVRYSRNSVVGGLRKDIRDFLDKNGYKTLMDHRKDGQYTRLYIAGDSQTVRGFVLVNLDDNFNYGRFICLEGSIPQEKFQRLISKILK